MPTTLLGIVIGIGIMIGAIIGVANYDVAKFEKLTTYQLYLNLPSFLIVIGGTLAATLIAHPFSHLVRGFKAFFIVFIRKELDFIAIIEDICGFSVEYSQKGVPGLEEKIKTYTSEDLLKDSINMIINGYKPEEILQFLEHSINRRYDQEMIDYYVFRTMSRTAPAFGMVGTLVGLIFMLQKLGDNPKLLGPFLAVALITTFYGLILANLVFGPMGNKLLHHAELNMRIGRMIYDGVNFILQKQHPVFIKDQLAAYVPPHQRNRLFKKTPLSVTETKKK
ncbi:MAG: MotA/TolQ/ExbB proton channel family protein [Endomicrobia bacterium]|nr:MotA/TolQ/ExbB proton channel family protein [Endomicrobiia bacterium]